MTNEWLQGYRNALNNIKSFCKTSQIGSELIEEITYQRVLMFIEQTENNYRLLVKELNEAQSKKTTP